MKTDELHQKLIEAYSVSNLNKIAVTLISFYKNQQFSLLKKIALHISDSVSIEIDDKGKGFSSFMMLYHPDRANFHINAINKLSTENNYDGLLEYAHILLLSRIDEVAALLENYEEIDYDPVYQWDFNTEGFTIFNDNDTSKSSKGQSVKEKTPQKYYNFYDAVKIRMFDNTRMEYPSYYLEDIDEFELSSSDINDLEGVEFCKHVTNLDLSNNHICDLTPLSGLSFLEELNLSDNKIFDIDALSNLENLKVLNLSNNQIDDIKPIMNLPLLEYIDLTGTKVGKKQVEELQVIGVAVEI